MADRKYRRFALFGLLAAWLMLAGAPGFGKAETKAEESEKGAAAEATPKETPRPKFDLGPSLKGRYDMTVLLASDRVTEFQYELTGIRGSAGRKSNWIVQMSLVLEFGCGSGVAECERNEMKVREAVRAVLMNQQSTDLLTTAGKMQLKREIIALINANLKSASVRQVYLTEFYIVPMR